jgi:hypothetical protein
MAKMDYNAINFKNKDVDKFTAKFNQPDPGKGFVSSVKGTMGDMVSQTKKQVEGKRKEDALNRKKTYWMDEYLDATNEKKRSVARDSLESLGEFKPRKKP